MRSFVVDGFDSGLTALVVWHISLLMYTFLRLVLLTVLVTFVSTGFVAAAGPAPAESLEDAAAFDFPDVPGGLTFREYRKEYVGKGLHRLYDLVSLEEYELADAHWAKLMEYQRRYPNQLTVGMFHATLWAIGYGKGGEGEKAVAAYMYARALEVRSAAEIERLLRDDNSNRSSFNEYMVLYSNAVSSAIEAGWIEQAKALKKQAEEFLLMGLQINLNDLSMPVYANSQADSLLPLDYAFGSYLRMRGKVAFISGDIKDAEFSSLWLLKIWKAHVPAIKVIPEKGYNRNHYSLDLSAVAAYRRLTDIYDLLREPDKAHKVSADMASHQRMNDLDKGGTMTRHLRAHILRDAQINGVTEDALLQFDSVRVIPIDKRNEFHDPSVLGWQEKGIKAELLWHTGQREQAVQIYKDQLDKIENSTNAAAWVDLLETYVRLRVESGETSFIVESDLVRLLQYFRERGIKPGEFNLYLLYATWLENREEYAEATEMLRHALRIAHLIGNDRLINLVEERIADLIKRWQGSSLESLTAEGIEGSISAESIEHKTDAKSVEVIPVEVGNRSIDMQPQFTKVSTAQNEFARARFTLTSLSEFAQTGELSFDAPLDTLIEKDIEGGIVWIKYGQDDYMAHKVLLSIGALEQWQIFIERTLEADVDESVSIELDWQTTGASSANMQMSVAEFSVDTEGKATHSVHMNHGSRNAFYAIPFYHEVYFRKLMPAVADVRIVASKVCRVEYYNPSNLELLAIDANGDGDFKDAGDVIYIDDNYSTYPDMVLDTVEQLGSIEFHVFVPDGDASVTLGMQMSADGGNNWILMSTDSLELQ